MRRLALATLVVPDYDAALRFFVGVLGFQLVEDTALLPGKRWVVVSPGADGVALLLAKAATESQAARIGDQTGGRVAFFLETNDFAGEHARLLARGVPFEEAPRREAYGTVAVFRDPFGNRWDLIEPAPRDG